MKTKRISSLLSFSLLLAPAYGQAQPAVITSGQVEASVLKFFPLIEEAAAKLDQARGELLSSRGEFDFKLKVKSANRFDEKYDYRHLETSLEKQLPLSGLQLYAGHLLGDGSIPAYSGKYETPKQGEAFVGGRLPLLRGRSIDEARFGQLSATLGEERAESELAFKRNYYVHKALTTFQKWKLAQKKHEVRLSLRDLAAERQKMLDRQVHHGDTDKMSAVDGRRSLLKREEEALDAKIELEQVKLQMSLFVRSEAGEPRTLDDSQPEFTDVSALPANLTLADRKVPQLEVINTSRELAQQSIGLARNQRLPKLDLEATAFRNLGSTEKLSRDRVQVGLYLEIPFENRKGRGKEAEAMAKVAAYEQQQAYATRELQTSLEQAHVSLKISSERIRIIEEELTSAQKVAEAERHRWKHGDSNLFLVAAREQEAASTEIRLWSARYDYEKALLDARLALGDFSRL